MQVGRLLKTVRYLKFEQLIYQIKYRLIGYSKGKKASEYQYSEDVSILIDELDMHSQYRNRFYPESLLNNIICLLNESFCWQPGKWVNKEATHLWNFNLHYFEYAVAMAGQYKTSGDIRYFEKFKELYQDWWENFENDVKGDAWHPYTISLRIPNLLICIDLFEEPLVKEKEFRKQLYDSIYVQYCFLEKNQEKNLLGNHYFENLKTLYISSILFLEKKKQRKYEKILLKEINVQILPDGMHYERSIMYHNIILEDLMRIERVSRYSDNLEFRQKIIDTIQRMSDVICALEDLQNDRIPQFNDAGSGVAKTATQLIEATQELYGYAPAKKRAFEEAGYYVLNNNGIKVIFDCGDMGPRYITGHGHCDALSFELFADGQSIFVNAGTYQYQTSLRGFFRSTKAHNTVQIGNAEQANCWGEHRTAERFEILDIWQDDENSVGGSVRYYNGDVVKRELIIADSEVIVHDSVRLRRDKGVPICSYFRTHPSCDVDICENKNRVQIQTATAQWILSAEKEVADIVLHTDEDTCWYSEQLGKKEKTSVLEVKWKEQIKDLTIVLKRG